MKNDRLALLVVIAVMLLVILTFARFSQIEQQLTRQSIEQLNLRMDNFMNLVRTTDSKLTNYWEQTKQLEERLATVEAERTDLWQKLTRLSQDIENVRTLMAATSSDVNKQVVELGSISVKSNEKVKK
ncbi:MAG: hypothetical protein N2606_02770 [Candidatus Omnitrophica bacterium]|nr:hypothetical protein [Candidatus Omnitrophota bacterium]